MEKNIVLDFTATQAVAGIANDQPLAIMPAELAKKLLKTYAKNLIGASSYEIIQGFKDSIASDSDSIDDVMNKCVEFVQERTLIEHCAKEQWDYFNTERETLSNHIRETLNNHICGE